MTKCKAEVQQENKWNNTATLMQRVVTPKNKTNNTIMKQTVAPEKKPKRKQKKKVKHNSIINMLINELWMQKKPIETSIDTDFTNKPTECNTNLQCFFLLSTCNNKGETLRVNRNEDIPILNDYVDSRNRYMLLATDNDNNTKTVHSNDDEQAITNKYNKYCMCNNDVTIPTDDKDVYKLPSKSYDNNIDCSDCQL